MRALVHAALPEWALPLAAQEHCASNEDSTSLGVSSSKTDWMCAVLRLSVALPTSMPSTPSRYAAASSDV